MINKSNRIYATGYTSRQPEELLALAVKLNAVIADVRFSAASRVPKWRKTEMSEFFGDIYRHVPQLGNRNYKSGDLSKAEIEDFPKGLKFIRELLKKSNVILLCACRRQEACHRHLLKQLLAEYELFTEEICWSEAQDSDADKQLLLF